MENNNTHTHRQNALPKLFDPSSFYHFVPLIKNKLDSFLRVTVLTTCRRRRKKTTFWDNRLFNVARLPATSVQFLLFRKYLMYVQRLKVCFGIDVNRFYLLLGWTDFRKYTHQWTIIIFVYRHTWKKVNQSFLRFKMITSTMNWHWKVQ